MGHNWLDEVLGNSMNRIFANVPKRQALISKNECRANPDQKMNKNEFRARQKPDEKKLEETPCEFYVSAFRLPMDLGSKEANTFMRALIDSPNEDILNQDIIMIYTNIMWLQAQKYVFGMAFINLFFAILLTSSISNQSLILYGFLAAFLVIFIYYEIVDFFIMKLKNYFSVFWNYADLIRIG